MKKLIGTIYLILGCLIAATTAGCGGSSSPGPNSFAGTFSGSYYSSSGDLGPITLTIDSTGAITASATDVVNPGTFTLTGTTTSAGTASTTTNGGVTATGTFTRNSHGQLVGRFTNTGGTTTTITATTSGASLPYAGIYSGTYLTSGSATGTASVTIDSTANIFGSATSGGGSINLSGSVTPTGVTSLTVTQSGTPINTTGAMAFNASGQLIVYVTANGTSNSTEFTLSLAG